MFDALKQVMTTRESPGDYLENGILHCGKCRTPKQALLRLPALTGSSEPRPFPVACRCEQEREKSAKEAKEAEEFSEKMKRLWSNGVHDRELLRWKFSDNDGEQGKIFGIARKYIEKWPEMSENNIGILLFGPVGTGKSFLASCVANDLLQQRVPVCATGFSRILNILQSTFDGKQDVLDSLGRFQLLFLDDLGSERDSSFALEQLFAVVDARYRAKRPTIITTNLSLKDIENPQNLAYSRIFDRVLEMCPIRLAVTGPSRRHGLAEKRAQLARELLL